MFSFCFGVGFILDEPSNVTNADDPGRPTNLWMEPSETVRYQTA